MKFLQSPLAGAWVVELERMSDDRGSFARTWCRDEFQAKGLNTNLEQCSMSFNTRRGTLRGMHYQARPYSEAKLVRCTNGSIYDVIIDLRPKSKTFRKWFSIELSAVQGNALYVPEGVAHGFQTLTDGSEVFYQITQSYQPEYARGVRWNDPAFGIEWPLPVSSISARDAAYPDFQGQQV